MTEQINYYPEKTVGGITGWNWISTDTGAWDGPKSDWENYHCPSIIKYVKSYRTVIQAGGNQGMYPRLLSRLFQNVYTFEPDPLNFKTLVLNSDNDNIIKFQAALGEKNDYCVVNRLTMTNTGMHMIKLSASGVVPVLSLDQTFADMTNVDLVMLDLEGYEFNALQGMLRLIEQNKPAIFVERASRDVEYLLKNTGYSKAGTSSMDSVFVAY